FDTYRMAASAIDEAIRNCVAVGAGQRRIAIPPSLLISAMGQLDDVEKAVTMDFKSPGNPIYVVGLTRNEMGGSHFAKVRNLAGGDAPRVDPELAKPLFAAVRRAIENGCVRACHDLSEGGLAVSLAEMAFSGGWGAEIDIEAVPRDDEADASASILFSESNSRFLLEVDADQTTAFEQAFDGLPFARVGVVNDDDTVVVRRGDAVLIRAGIDDLKAAWQNALDW
ncbi:MAG: hypothetical protein D6741_14300, partial [Planctomycetota bacterium]